MNSTHRRKWPKCPDITIRGRVFRQSEVVLIRRIIRDHPTWGRTRISQRVCTELDWVQLNGLPKERACRIALTRLDSLGLVDLPPPRYHNCGGKPPTIHAVDDVLFPRPPVRKMPDNIEVRRVTSSADAKLWNSLIARHHYLGLAPPVGKLVRYLYFSDAELLGAISFTGSTWSSQPRSEALRAVGLDPSPAPEFVVSNNRFLILPNVRVKNLASKILSSSIRQVRRDWVSKYRFRPLIAETFVDPSRFSGTSYLAANWIPIGLTKGYSKRGQTHYRHNQQKIVLLRGICPRYHSRLAAIYNDTNVSRPSAIS